MLKRFRNDLYTRKEPPLTNKVFIVTGATTGLGRGLVNHLMALGSDVILPCRRIPDGFEEELVAEAIAIQELHGDNTGTKNIKKAQITLVRMDLSDLVTVKSCVEEIASKFIRVDGLINNAGLVNSNLLESKQGYELSFAVNFLGPAYFTKLLLEKGLLRPLRNEGGEPQIPRIVSVSSEEHRIGKPLKEVEPFGSHVCDGVLEVMEWYGYSKLAQTTFFLKLGKSYSSDQLVSLWHV